jgi:type I restriction enzyme S subunit
MEVKPGYKQTEVGIIPEEWEVRKIGEMFRLINGCAFKPGDWKQHGIPIIRIQNLNDPSAEFNFSQATVPERNRVEAGDLLFAWSGTLGSSFGARVWYGPSGVLNQHIFKVLMDEQQITLPYSLLVFARVEEDIAKQAHGFKASFVHVKKSDLVKVDLPLPPLPEQRAIAEALSDVDGLLGGLERLIAKKRNLKQAAMQQLLTGQIRLPGFHGKWEVKRLGSIADVLKGSALSKSLMTTSGTLRCILYGELFTTYGRVISDVFGRTNSSEGCPSIQGDVLMPGSTTTKGIDLATASALLVDDVALGGDIIIIRRKGNDYDSVFLANYLTLARRHEIAELTQGITIHHLYGKDLKTLALELPPYSEQTAIAEVLTEMDAELAAWERRLEKTRALKQALMQELLTGRTRLI